MTESSYEIVEFKATGDEPGEPTGLFAAIVSTFGNVDRNGDKMMPGSFTKTLQRWREKGQKIPVIFSHEHKDPDAYIGEVDPADVKETDAGLVVAGKLDIDTNPKAKRIWDLLKSGRLKEWSFAFQVLDERIGKDRSREVLDVELFEIGPTLIGANGLTSTLAVKEHGGVLEPIVTEALAGIEGEVDAMIDTKVGRFISARTEAKVRAAMAELSELLSALGSQEEPTEQASSTPEEKAVEEEPATPGETEQLRQKLEAVGVYLAGKE